MSLRLGEVQERDGLGDVGQRWVASVEETAAARATVSNDSLASL